MRRDKRGIIADILKVCKRQASGKTRIVYTANMNFKTAGRYLDWMVSKGLVAKEGKHFKVLPKGDELLGSLRQTEGIMRELEEINMKANRNL